MAHSLAVFTRGGELTREGGSVEVGRCRLTLSHPR
jgi:hypothetical protein